MPISDWLRDNWLVWGKLALYRVGAVYWTWFDIIYFWNTAHQSRILKTPWLTNQNLCWQLNYHVTDVFWNKIVENFLISDKPHCFQIFHKITKNLLYFLIDYYGRVKNINGIPRLYVAWFRLTNVSLKIGVTRRRWTTGPDFFFLDISFII